jgi:four helix bundle protein
MSDPRNLRVLEAAMQFTAAVHQHVDTFDITRAPRVRAQLLRAADSVPANIAEGARGTRVQRQNYFRIARASADEVGVHLRVARGAGAVADSTYWQCENKRAVVCKMLTRLIRVLEEEEAHTHNRTRP